MRKEGPSSGNDLDAGGCWRGKCCSGNAKPFFAAVVTVPGTKMERGNVDGC
jgi:hypothetical protein